MMSTEIDENLIVRMGQGDGEAFREFYLASSDIVFGYALSILRNRHDAEDVMHDAYLRAYRSADTYQALGKPLAWLLTIVKNLCYNSLNAGKTLSDIDSHDELSPVDETQESLDRIVVEKTLSVLDEQERQIVILHAMTGFKHREIADVMNMPTGTVLSKYHRALKRLRIELEEKGQGI